MMDYVIQKHQAKYFEGECAEENVGSAHVLEKLGLSFVRKSSYAKRDGSRTFNSRVYRMEVGKGVTYILY